MKTNLLPFFLILVPLGVSAQDSLNPHQQVITAASGVYDMSKEPRRYPFLLILDQDTLDYPSFWAGGNAEGNITFAPETDLLTGELDLNTTGTFSLWVTNSTRKLGMEKTLPGGPWMVNTRDRGFKVTFETFANARPGEVRRGRDGGTVEVHATAKGHVVVDGKRSPFEGEVTFVFSERIPTFVLRASFTFEGAPLGLDGKQAGPIQASVSTLSPLGDPVPPKPADGRDPFGDLGF